MYRVRQMERCARGRATLEYVIICIYITCRRSRDRGGVILIYKVIFEVLHHTKSSETLHAEYLHQLLVANRELLVLRILQEKSAFHW